MDYAPGPKPVEHSVASYTAGAIGVIYASTRSQVGEMVPPSRSSGSRDSDSNDSRTWTESSEAVQQANRPIQQKDAPQTSGVTGGDGMKWLKLATQGSGWAVILSALTTMLLKQLGFEINDAALGPLVASGLGLIHGGAYIPVPSVAPVMSELHNKTIDALYHLDGILDGEDVKKAIGVLWNAARSLPQEVKK